MFLAVECAQCGHYSERQLAWLRHAREMACDSCTAAIDLSSGANRAIIDGHVELALRLDVEFGHR
jgi:ribosomal protein S27E